MDALSPSHVMKTSTECIHAVTQVVEKAHSHTSCPVSFVGIDTSDTDGNEITRKQRQGALDALKHNVTEVMEWPCHWRVSQDAAQKLATTGRKMHHEQGAGCYSVTAQSGSGRHFNDKSSSREEPHPLWATATYWREALQGMQFSVRLIIRLSKALLM